MGAGGAAKVAGVEGVTPSGGPLNERYWRDFFRGLWFIAITAAVFGFILWVMARCALVEV